MSCFEWHRLLAHRFEEQAPEPEGWPEALEHLAACDECRSAALAVDPTLAFRTLPAPEVEPGEVAEMQKAVRAVRRAARVSGTEPRQRNRFWWRAAAVGFLVLSALSLSWDAGERAPEILAGGDARTAIEMPTAIEAHSVDLARMPLIEELDRPRARVYQFGSAELAVVLIVDESFDV